MKRQLLLIKLLFAVLVLHLSLPANLHAQEKGYDSRHPFYNSYLNDASDKPVNLKHYRGNIVFVTFWATWCQRCVKQIKIMDDLYVAAEKSNIIFLPINIDFRGIPLIKKAYDSYDIDNLRPVMDVNGKAVKYLDISVLPTTVILDETGVVRKRIVGQRTWNIDYVNSIILDVKEIQKKEHARNLKELNVK